ncbi:MAG: DinB family protein [Armatimonadota bacterium]
MTNTHYLVEGLRLSPSAISRVIAHVDPSMYDTAIDEGRFTLREAVAHLADWEPILLGRIKQAAEEPGSIVHGIDESQRAIDQKYSETDLTESLAKFTSERAKTVEYVKGLSNEQWSNAAIHNERGPHTASDFAWTMVGHDTYHFEQFARYLS